MVGYLNLSDPCDVEALKKALSTKQQAVSEDEMVPDGVAYDRIAVVLLPIVQRQKQQISLLEAEIAQLRERLDVLEGA